MKDVAFPKLVGARELAEILGVSRAHVLNLTVAREIPFLEVSLGRGARLTYRYDPLVVMDAIQKKTEASMKERFKESSTHQLSV